MVGLSTSDHGAGNLYYGTWYVTRLFKASLWGAECHNFWLYSAISTWAVCSRASHISLDLTLSISASLQRTIMGALRVFVP
jgi:hypothetical protein